MAHYTSCMPTEWPPQNLARLKELGMPADAEQAASITKYGKTIANRFWVSHASNAHGFMYRRVHPSCPIQSPQHPPHG